MGAVGSVSVMAAAAAAMIAVGGRVVAGSSCKMLPMSTASASSSASASAVTVAVSAASAGGEDGGLGWCCSCSWSGGMLGTTMKLSPTDGVKVG